MSIVDVLVATGLGCILGVFTVLLGQQIHNALDEKADEQAVKAIALQYMHHLQQPCRVSQSQIRLLDAYHLLPSASRPKLPEVPEDWVFEWGGEGAQRELLKVLQPSQATQFELTYVPVAGAESGLSLRQALEPNLNCSASS